MQTDACRRRRRRPARRPSATPFGGCVDCEPPTTGGRDTTVLRGAGALAVACVCAGDWACGCGEGLAALAPVASAGACVAVEAARDAPVEAGDGAGTERTAVAVGCPPPHAVSSVAMQPSSAPPSPDFTSARRRSADPTDAARERSASVGSRGSFSQSLRSCYRVGSGGLLLAAATAVNTTNVPDLPEAVADSSFVSESKKSRWVRLIGGNDSNTHRSPAPLPARRRFPSSPPEAGRRSVCSEPSARSRAGPGRRCSR